MLLKKVVTAFSASALMSAAEAATISAESESRITALVVVQKQTYGFIGREAGVFCSTESGVPPGQVVMLSPGGSFLAACDGRTTFWSPQGSNTSPTENFTMTLINSSRLPAVVNIHGGVRGSANGWPALKTVTLPAKRACSMEYSPSVSFSLRRGAEPLRSILWGATGNSGSLTLQPSSSIADGGVIVKGSDYIAYDIVNRSGKPVWNQNDRTWSGSTRENYLIVFRSTLVPAGVYSGSIRVTINCN